MNARPLRSAPRLCLALCMLISPWGAGPASAQTPATFEDAVLEIIRRNPEVVLEALQGIDTGALVRREAADRRPVGDREVRSAGPGPEEVAAHAGALHDLTHAVVLGDPDAAHTIVEFIDFRCGFCRRVHPTVKQVIERHRDVRVVLRQFPILGPESENAALVFLAAVSQDRAKAAAFADLLIAHEGPFDIGTLAALAGGLGYDAAALREAAPSFRGAIERERELTAALGIRGTPAFVFGARFVMPGARPYDAFVAFIDRLRAAPTALAPERRSAAEEFMAAGDRPD